MFHLQASLSTAEHRAAGLLPVTGCQPCPPHVSFDPECSGLFSCCYIGDVIISGTHA
ncbi:hypothetical protein Cadr_000007091 [Camelus dromedarius]|uniref:Uncharacterized protein n=1 Tax=Camelus dromedarius TaxID=9838 RepID=A0A5N4E6J3_CAMDR|nr:hypothetical protein Cadr_000007091 [Camelus dromedarius]